MSYRPTTDTGQVLCERGMGQIFHLGKYVCGKDRLGIYKKTWLGSRR